MVPVPDVERKAVWREAEAHRPEVGRALIEGVYAKARVVGSPRVYWHTQESNKTAQLLYDKLAEKSGFIVYRQNM